MSWLLLQYTSVFRKCLFNSLSIGSASSPPMRVCRAGVARAEDDGVHRRRESSDERAVGNAGSYRVVAPVPRSARLVRSVHVAFEELQALIWWIMPHHGIMWSNVWRWPVVLWPCIIAETAHISERSSTHRVCIVGVLVWLPSCEYSLYDRFVCKFRSEFKERRRTQIEVWYVWCMYALDPMHNL